MRRGSITLYLCLVLGALLSLVCTAMLSARNAAGRAVLASAAEQGMYSLFSRYDRTLFDDYGILAIDGGYSSSQLKLGALLEEAEDVTEYLTGSSGDLTGPSNLMHLSPEEGEVTGYALLTDNEGSPLREQIFRTLTEKKTEVVIQNVKDQLNGYSSEWKKLEEVKDYVDVKKLEQEYSNLQQSIEESSVVPSSFQGDSKRDDAGAVFCNIEEDSELLSETIQEDAENPIELICTLMQQEILGLVLPEGGTVSSGTIEEDRVSNRTLQQGMGIAADKENSLTDKELLLEYIIEFFDDFTDADEGAEGLRYHAEYAIGGMDSDQENLKIVVNRLLAVREASNYLFLLKDPAKQREVETAVHEISTQTDLSEAEPVISELLRFCWAFGESVLDIRELLQGGKIPLMKDAASWQLSLKMLTHIQENLAEQHSTERGLDYQWYLRLLMVTKDEASLTDSLMDLIEHRIRNSEDRDGFRLDNCLVSMKICFRAKQDHLFPLEAERSYNYTQ